MEPTTSPIRSGHESSVLTPFSTLIAREMTTRWIV
jgi:hypothetical protein